MHIKRLYDYLLCKAENTHRFIYNERINSSMVLFLSPYLTGETTI